MCKHMNTAVTFKSSCHMTKQVCSRQQKQEVLTVSAKPSRKPVPLDDQAATLRKLLAGVW